MTVTLLPERTDTATLLRELEQSAPAPTSKAIRAAMIQAAQQLEAWEQLASDAARQLDEAANIRLGQMDSPSRAADIQRGIQRTMLELARQFREKA